MLYVCGKSITMRPKGIKETKPRQSRRGGPLGRSPLPDEDRREIVAIYIKKSLLDAVYSEIGTVREGNKWIRDAVEKIIKEQVLETDL